MSIRTQRLVAGNAVPPEYRYFGYIRAPGQLLCPEAVSFPALQHQVRQHLFKHVVPSLMWKAEPYLLIDGPTGVGKTTVVCDTAQHYGFAVALLPASLLASPHEGGATEILDEFILATAAWSRLHGRHVMVQVDDFDRSIAAATDDKTGRTVNTGLLVNRFQTLAGDRRQHVAFDGSPVPWCFTGNNFTTMPETLFRDGRATRFTHVPTQEERTAVALRLLAPSPGPEEQLVRQLAEEMADQPVAYWRSLANDLAAARLAPLIGTRLPDIARVEEALQQPFALERADLWRLARARAASHARNHLNNGEAA